MHPQLDLDYFQFDLYTVFIALGILLGLAAAYIYLSLRSRHAYDLEIFLDGALLVLATGWAGARAYHILTHWDYYQARPEEITQLGLGGLGIRGALLLGLIALALYARVRHLSFARLADAAALGLALGQAVGWIGALVQGANYGLVSDSRLAMELPDLYGIVAPRLPVQHMAIIVFAMIFVALAILAFRRPRSGVLCLLYLLVSSIAGALLGFARADETAYAGALRVDQIVDIGVALVALVGLGLVWIKARAAVRVETPTRITAEV